MRALIKPARLPLKSIKISSAVFGQVAGNPSIIAISEICQIQLRVYQRVQSSRNNGVGANLNVKLMNKTVEHENLI